jgi:hypothetical protein
MASPTSTESSCSNNENKFNLTIEVPERGNGLRDGMTEQPKHFFREQVCNLFTGCLISSLNYFKKNQSFP